jgi:hypothetical protein
MGLQWVVYQLFINFKKVYNLFRREILYNIVIEFYIPMELVRLIKTCLNEICRRVHIDNHLSVALLNCTISFWTVLIFDINLLDKNRNTMKKNMETIFCTIKEVSVELSAEKTKYKFMSSDQNAGENHSI